LNIVLPIFDETSRHPDEANVDFEGVYEAKV